jgi:hypothetical protein
MALMSESGILTVHLRGRIREDELRDELAQLLGVSRENLAPLDGATPATLVPYQYTQRARGFLSTIEVYAGRLPESVPRTDLGVAERLASRFAQDALISPPAGSNDPYRWLLVRPDGTTAEVSEVPQDEDEDGIVIVEPGGA